MCGTLHAQHYIGVRGGWGGGSARFTPARETKLEWGLYSGGLSYKFYTAQKYVGGIQVDLQYMGRGFAYDLQSKSDSSYHRTINSFELPFMWQPHIYVFQRHGRIFLNLGVYLSYMGGSEYYYKSKKAGIYEEGPYQKQVTRDTRWGYGLCGGAGIGFDRGTGQLLCLPAGGRGVLREATGHRGSRRWGTGADTLGHTGGRPHRDAGSLPGETGLGLERNTGPHTRTLTIMINGKWLMVNKGRTCRPYH